MTSSQPLRWGIIGPGGIAQAFLAGLEATTSGKLVAIGTRNPDKPGLSETFRGARIVDGYQALLDDKEINAVYIATPHPGHAEWAIKAAEAGKHALIEKPMGLSAFEAQAMFDAAKKAGTFMGEAFMYRLHPATAKLLELIRGGAIGEVRLIKSSFGFAMPRVMPEHRLYANDLAGGGILDVGCYPVSMSRLIAGAVAGKPFLDPKRTQGAAYLGQTGTDEWASAVLEFDNGIIAEVSCSVSLQQDNVLRIFGTTGRIEVPDFWFAGGDRSGGPGRIHIIRRDGTSETVETGATPHLYSFEADGVAAAVAAGRQEFASPGMSWADTLGNLRTLDKWRADAGLVYGIETSSRRPNTIRNEALRQSSRGSIPRRQIKGLSQPTSLVAMGFEYFPNYSSASILLDAFYERGGNLFDTAWLYNSGKSESYLGDWWTTRGLKRDSFLVIGKGAHAPLCYPDVIGKQLTQSLDRLKTDHVDAYFTHRDNLDVPVEEFVDAFDAEVKAGRIKGPYGGSNWTRERLDAATAYANKTGKTPPGAFSNNFSLAEMIRPIWAGCIAASDDQWKAWLKDRQLPNFAWSSQGRGFFTEAAGRDKFDNQEIVDTWYSERNFVRRDRAIELAKQLGRNPIHIALAYVLAQPFQVVPLIGPRSVGELEDSLSALDIQLTPEQVRWLEA